MKKLLLNISLIVFTLATVIIWFEPETAILSKLGYTLLIVGLVWYRQTMLWDWEYIKNWQKWSTWAGLWMSRENNAWAKVIDTGAIVQGKRVVIDTTKISGKYLYLLRWTVYEDEVTGLKLLRDNSKFLNCWYIML